MFPVAIVEKTSDAEVKGSNGHLHSATLTAGADAATVVLYDNTAASGTKLLTLKAAANTTVVWAPTKSSPFGTGLYADLTGTGPAVYIQYE